MSDWILTLSARDKTTGMNIASTMTSLRTCRNMAATAAQASPADDIAEQPGEAPAEGRRDRRPRTLRQPHADELEDVFVLFLPHQVGNLLRVQFHVQHAEDAPLRVDHGQGQQAVQNEELAGVRERRRRRQGDDLPHHDVGQRRLGRIQQQAPCGDHALEAVLGIDHVEVDDAAFDPAILQPPEGLPHRLAHEEPHEILMGVPGYRVAQVLLGDRHRNGLGALRGAASGGAMRPVKAMRA